MTFRLLRLALPLLTIATGAGADYLNDPGAFAAAWARVLPRMTDRVEVMLLRVEGARIDVFARAPETPDAIDLWQVRRGTTALAGGDLVAGPLPVTGRPDLPAHGFGLDEVPLDRIDALVAAALEAGRTGPEGRAVTMVARRPAAEGATPGRVQITIAVRSPTREGEVRIAGDGRVILDRVQEVAAPPPPVAALPPAAAAPADAPAPAAAPAPAETSAPASAPAPAETSAPAPAPAPASAPAPAAAPAPAPPSDQMVSAEAALAAEVGPGAVVWELVVRRDTITVTATDPADPDRTRRLRLSPAGLQRDDLSLPNRHAPFGGRPFALADARLAGLGRMIEAAQAAAGPAAGPLQRAEAGLVLSGGVPQVQWTLVFAPEGAQGRAQETRVAARPDATVLRVVPPEGQRPAFRGDSGEGLARALAELSAALGPDALIWEIDARPDRVSIDRPHPTRPGTTAITTYTAEGIGPDREFPVMMQTEADLFPLSLAAGLTPAAIEAARAAGLAGVGLPGGELERLRLWSGAPFWRHPRGEPFFDIRVGVPPNGNPGGYAVVTLDGRLVRAFR